VKTWTDLSSIDIPPRVASMARDARGYPIPFFAARDGSGAPDFRIMDNEKWVRATRLRCCGICGEHLGSRVAFVGGPLSMQSRFFRDLPMHRDCAVYAVRVCPFIAAPSFGYAKAVPQGADVSANVSDERPERFGLAITKGFAVRRLNGELVIQAQPFESVQWWLHGGPLQEVAG
jgi:hypothetical protein